MSLGLRKSTGVNVGKGSKLPVVATTANGRYRRDLAIPAHIGHRLNSTRPRHCPLAPLMAAMRSTSVDGVQVRGTPARPLSRAAQLASIRSDDWCVALVNGSGGSSSFSGSSTTMPRILAQVPD